MLLQLKSYFLKEFWTWNISVADSPVSFVLATIFSCWSFTFAVIHTGNILIPSYMLDLHKMYIIKI